MDNKEKALELIREIKDNGCIATHINPNGSDYHCRYCDRETKSHSDFTIKHDEDCIWLRIKDIE